MKLDHWEQFLYLKTINSIIKPETDKEIEVWKRINCSKFIEFGGTSILDSFPRIFKSAFAYRSDYDEKVMKSDDMKIYLQFRNSYDFGPANCEFDSVYNEFYSILSNSSINLPKKNNIINIKHPLHNNKWTKTTLVQSFNRRVILTVDDSFYQMALLFFGGWKRYLERAY